MAKEVIQRVTDDLDGSEATHTDVSFSFENNSWTIDLNDGHYNELRAAVERFAEHATRVSGGRGRGRSASASAGSNASKKSELQAIRAWAESNGIELNARGRIKESIIAAYHENDPSLVGG